MLQSDFFKQIDWLEIWYETYWHQPDFMCAAFVQGQYFIYDYINHAIYDQCASSEEMEENLASDDYFLIHGRHNLGDDSALNAYKKYCYIDWLEFWYCLDDNELKIVLLTQSLQTQNYLILDPAQNSIILESSDHNDVKNFLNNHHFKIACGRNYLPHCDSKVMKQ